MLRTTVVLLVLGLLALARAEDCSSCDEVNSCVVVDTGVICYQADDDAPPNYMSLVQETDPVVKNGEGMCDTTCAALGYDSYVRNDPVYTQAELWVPSSSQGPNPPTEVDANDMIGQVFDWVRRAFFGRADPVATP